MRLHHLFLGFVLTASANCLAFDHTHRDWTGVLLKYQDAKGLLRYAALKKDVAAGEHTFNRYLGSLQSVSSTDYDKWSPEQKKAFLINAYNALTVRLILENYPVASIQKIGGFFKKPWSIEFFNLLGGKLKALDPIEHDYLRPQFKDYRVHAALNCASLSCPPLRHEAYVAERLEAQLDEQMRAWLADSSRNEFSADGHSWTLSKIFDWYKEDFEKWGGGVKAVVVKFGPRPNLRQLAAQAQVKFQYYDWDLNEAR